jgi:hypothetical protein
MKKFLLVGLFLLTMFSVSGAATHDYVIDNAPGVTVRADINSAFQAIVTNNSSATEPATLYPNMWWYDTSTSLLKRRNNANDAWITTGLEAADTDGTLAANSDLKIATQKATKTYADTKATKGANSDITSLSGLTTPLSRAQGGLASTVANNAASGPVFLDASSKLPAVDGSALTGLSAGGYTGMQVFTSSGTWIKPAAISKVRVICIGGGGAGYFNSGFVTNGGDSTFVGSTTVTGGGGGSSTGSSGAGGVGSGGSLNLTGWLGTSKDGSAMLGSHRGFAGGLFQYQYGIGGVAISTDGFGGAGGGYSEGIVSVTGNVTVTVGAGGTNSANGQVNGTAGLVIVYW